VKKLRITVEIEPGARLDDAVNAFRREVVFSTLDACRGHIPTAAKNLGRSRSGLWRELWERHGVTQYETRPFRASRTVKVKP
jgi:transcriptional regulator of acetoin/glycerol metabolism